MILQEWEIWHTYSTYLKGGVKDLDSVAREFIKSGLAFCVMHRDGMTYWQAEEELRSGLTTIESNQEGSEATINIKSSDGGEVNFEGFTREAWFQIAYFRFGEIRLFGEDLTAPPPYIRAFLGQYTLMSKEDEQPKHIVCYPIVKLYESGVLILELRIISPQRSVPLKEFIGKYVNLYKHEFDTVQVSPALAKLSPRAYLHYTITKTSLLDRYRLRKVEIGHDKTIEELTKSEKGGDFTFELAPLPSVVASGSGTLISLVMTIFGVIEFVASKRREGLEFLILGQHKLIEAGKYWEGRPHIHIIRHSDQRGTAAENEEKHRESFGWILSRGPNTQPENSARFLPANARVFSDYAAYITRQATLWVWAKKGLKAQKNWEDINRGHLIYEHQAQAEMLEYGYMLHRSLTESISGVKKSRDVFRLRRELSEMKSRMRRSSHYGEITDLLENGWKSMGVESLREEITENLAIREAETQMVEANRTEKVGRALTIVFGLAAVPPIASDVIQPIWDLLALWRPSSPAGAKLFMIFIAFTLVSVVIYGLLLTIPKSNSRK